MENIYQTIFSGPSEEQLADIRNRSCAETAFMQALRTAGELTIPEAANLYKAIKLQHGIND